MESHTEPDASSRARHRRNAKSTHDSTQSGASNPESAAEASSEPNTTFECNVCFDVPKDPVVTPCGHLYCWPCLYHWMRLHAESPQCPVCKAGVDRRSVIPIYGRGRNETNPTEKVPIEEEQVPPRPSGHRAPPATGVTGVPPFGVHHAAFGRINGHGYGDLSLSTSGLFPSLFGLQIAYPQMHEPPREEQRDNQEEAGISEMVARVFILLALFVAVILTAF